MCILIPDVMQQIIETATLHSMSFSHMDVPQDQVYDLILLFDMRTQEGPIKHVDFHFIGNVLLRNGLGFDKRGEPIAFRNNTLNANIGGKVCRSYLVTRYEG